MFKLKDKIFRQHDLGPYVGGFKDLAQRSMFYVTAINFILTIGISYSVFVNQWFGIGVFLGLLAFAVLVMMLVEYKFILPSTWSFVNRQTYKHKNPLLTKFEEFEEKMDKRMDVIEKKLNTIEDKNSQ